MNNAIGKIDFHLHSYASNVTGYYAANAFAIPESHSDPLQLYPLLKQRGMTLVTLTDHNSKSRVSTWEPICDKEINALLMEDTTKKLRHQKLRLGASFCGFVPGK